MRQIQLSTGCLSPFRLDIVIIPYQPSLVHRIVSVNNLNSSPLLLQYLAYLLLSLPPSCPLCTFLPTPSPRLTECLHLFLSSPLDIYKHYLTPAVRSFFYCTFCLTSFKLPQTLIPPSFSVPILLQTGQTNSVIGLDQAHLEIMACPRDHNATSASPNSSEEVESHHGTPATKLSPFSPDQVLDDLKPANQGIVRAKIPPPFVLARNQSNFGPNGNSGNSIVPGSQDPFLSVPNSSSNTQSSGDLSKLSPNASTFTPTSLIESVSSNATSSSSTFQYPLSAPVCGTGTQVLGFISPVSRSHNLQYGPIGKKPVSSGPHDTTILPLSLPAGYSFSIPGRSEGSIKLGQFSTDVSKSRSLRAGPVSKATTAKDIEKLLGVSCFDLRFRERLTGS